MQVGKQLSMRSFLTPVKDSPNRAHTDDDEQPGPSTSRAGQPNLAQPDRDKVVKLDTSSEDESAICSSSD